jgi:choline transport protein
MRMTTEVQQELKDASYVLPRAMIAGALFNGLLGFIMLLTLCFCLGDLEQVLESNVGKAGLPFIAVLAHGVQSNVGASIMTAILIILSMFCCITNIATASRQLFAFARDKAVPFHQILAFVSCPS